MAAFSWWTAAAAVRRALVGDQIAQLAATNGWAGIVVFGCIRDSSAIEQMDIGVFAVGTHPMKTVKRNEGQCDITVCFGGIDFVPGQYLYADSDGVIVSPRRCSDARPGIAAHNFQLLFGLFSRIPMPKKTTRY
jgi:regulator of RNase E activity RraA